MIVLELGDEERNYMYCCYRLAFQCYLLPFKEAHAQLA